MVGLGKARLSCFYENNKRILHGNGRGLGEGGVAFFGLVDDGLSALALYFSNREFTFSEGGFNYSCDELLM